HTPEYRLINPNGKTPAIEDEGQRVFDSNAILLYLSEKTGKLGGKPEDRAELLSWMMFIASGLGPYSGQSVHFR
ncbi:glutathione S-transferase family protein, partial [Vibrio sp. 10N.261.49.A5]